MPTATQMLPSRQDKPLVKQILPSRQGTLRLEAALAVGHHPFRLEAHTPSSVTFRLEAATREAIVTGHGVSGMGGTPIVGLIGLEAHTLNNRDHRSEAEMVTAYEASPKVVPGRHYNEAVSVGTGLQPVWCGVSPNP